MPHLQLNSAKIYYEKYGNGPQTIVFSHGLLWSGDMFAAQVRHFQHRYTCIVYDHRGQGRSEVTPTGYDMDTVYTDAVQLIEQLVGGPCHFAGLSMGGFVGMRLAIRRPDLLRSLTLMETSADPEPFKFKYTLLNTLVKLFGVKAVSSKVMPIMFGQTFMTAPARQAQRQEWENRLATNPKTITRAVEGVISRQGVYEQLPDIKTPTLILVGDEDVATIPDKARRIHAQIPHSQLQIIKGAGHSASVEEPEQVNRAIEAFLQNL